VRAGKVLHHYVIHFIAGLAPGKDGDYVRVGERRGATGLVPKALDKLAVLCEVVLEKFEGNEPI
jgi:hypothetical protein